MKILQLKIKHFRNIDFLDLNLNILIIIYENVELNILKTNIIATAIKISII